MIEIALGILLAVLILVYLPYLIFGGLIALTVVAVLAVAAISCLVAVSLGFPWWVPIPVLALGALVARDSSRSPTVSTPRIAHPQRELPNEISHKAENAHSNHIPSELDHRIQRKEHLLVKEKEVKSAWEARRIQRFAQLRPTLERLAEDGRGYGLEVQIDEFEAVFSLGHHNWKVAPLNEHHHHMADSIDEQLELASRPLEEARFEVNGNRNSFERNIFNTPEAASEYLSEEIADAVANTRTN